MAKHHKLHCSYCAKHLVHHFVSHSTELLSSEHVLYSLIHVHAWLKSLTQKYFVCNEGTSKELY